MKTAGYLRIALSALTLTACNAGVEMARSEDNRASLEGFANGVQPGCAMGIFGPGPRARYRLGGYANIALKKMIDENTQFLAASASKQFTALAILHLAAEGRLRLDDPARRWVPELANAVQDATIEQLLHQTAGVRDHVNLIILSGVDVLATVDRNATLALMSRQRNTNFPPGTRAQYSNGNYLVLSEIAARASGLPLDRYADQIIFAPLGMRNTQFLSSRDPSSLAQGYQPGDNGSGFALANDRPTTNGSGGLITTIVDLQKFDADFRSEGIVWRHDIKQRMLTPGRLRNGVVAILPEFGTRYGMGLGLADEQGDMRIFHDGGAEGFRAEYTRLLKGGVSVAVLCNRIDARAPSIADQALRETAGLPPAAVKAVPSAPATDFGTPSRQRLDAIAGTYRSDELDATFVFKIAEEGFDVTTTSPLAKSPSVGTWGGLRLADNGDILSGPIRLKQLGHGNTVRALSVSFGKRVEGIELKRVD